MRTIRFSFLSTNRVCLTLWGDPFGGDGLRGDLENLWNISKTHEPLCEQQCDHFCTKPELRMCPVPMALLHDNAGLFSYGDAVYPPLRDAHFPDVMGRLPLASWFRWWRGMESMEKHGKLWGCMGRFIRLGKSLAEPGKKDHGAAQGAILVGCWSCLAGNQHVQIQQIWIHWIPIFFVLRVFGANPLHCLYFSQRQREKIRLTQNRGQKILASHLPAMPRKTLFSFAPLLGFFRFQGLRSCNAYNLWFRMPGAKSNRPTCLRWIPQRSCWRFLTCSKRWNDALVAPMWDYWCW